MWLVRLVERSNGRLIALKCAAPPTLRRFDLLAR